MYQADLHYGYQRSHDDYGTYHAFELTDPDEKTDEGAMGEHLACLLDTTTEDEDFNFDLMRVNLPESLVEKIKADAVREYKAQQEKEWFGVVRWCDDDIREALEKRGLKASQDNVDEVRCRCESHHFTDGMIEAGWDALDYIVQTAILDEDEEEEEDAE